MAKYTPMIEQYLQVKNEHRDAILFFRLGDFYEMFFEDAEVASKELEIVLTARDGGQKKIPMCGIPYHSATNYIAKLIHRGYKIAICEQVEDPKLAKGIVKREVIKIITPGTIIDDNMLEENTNNYLAAVIEEKGMVGFSYIDFSTGDFRVTEFTGPDAVQKLESELHRLTPAECLVPEWSDLASLWQENLKRINHTTITNLIEPTPAMDEASTILMRHFNVATLEGFGLKGYSTGLKAASVIINFLNETQKTNMKHIKILRPYHSENYLDMDFTTRRNLELTAALRDGRREGSLLSVLDSCNTAMGKRTLKKWIEQPLIDSTIIESRLDAVEELVHNLTMRDQLKTALSDVYDMERLAGKLGSGIATPRDLIALKLSINKIGDLHHILESACSEILTSMAAVDLLEDVYDIINTSIEDEPPLSIKEGNIIKTGYNNEIDELRSLSTEGSNWLIDFENREKQRTGMKYLKIGFNKVFGYYIEITKSNLPMVPADYIRKQTLVNTERFISEELKNYEEKILGAREKLFTLEYHEFISIREKLSAFISRIQDTASRVAELDVLYALAETAYINDYVRPQIDNSGRIEIQGGRHPVVEQFLINTRFVPNDIKIDNNNSRFAIITGPNMGGKSTFMRQTALLVLMAQIGSFIPADKARIGLVDKIFTRVGASDDLASGQSTFMLEMIEVANILHNATEKSLVILDEIGRGTSTYDGLSIAQAVSEYILAHIKCRTLFATHYHELTSLGDELPGITNLCVSVNETGDTVVFLKKVLPGKADKSYGIHVARLAGLPENVINRADDILQNLECSEKTEIKDDKQPVVQPVLFSENSPVIDELKALKIDDLTPRQALKILYQWKETV
ncbi:MAG: DNA mismatch repair protein MutS [Syntrophomonadaceae bacterium]|nr:DNA mismatch repair protein MutS [Syntrophomonadaceae bacterium]MDD4549253.1 DNA mismatch repair protein MutS [Syntrophomonadaceae bacterium]